MPATNTIRQTRAKLIDLCADYGARIEIIYLEPPLPQLLDQNRNRPTPVPESIIHRLLDKLDPPTRVEGHAVRLVG
ncbi:MAG: AAA family ATPase [Pirellulaceae bacterium]